MTPFDKCVDHLKHELSALRTGRASVALLDTVMVDVYGTRTPIAHIASLNTPDAKTIVVQPWDKANMAAIEKAITASNIGLNPVNDGVIIRLSVPPMTEERRKEMVKVAGHLAEQARIAIRTAREEMVKELKRTEDDNEITKDDLENEKKDLQAAVDAANGQVKDLAAAKEKEIMTI